MFCLKLLSACTVRFYCPLHVPRLYWLIYCLLSRSVRMYYCPNIRWYCLLVLSFSLSACTVWMYNCSGVLLACAVQIHCLNLLPAFTGHFYCPPVLSSRSTVLTHSLLYCTTRFYNPLVLSTCTTVQLVVLACNCLRVMYTCTARLYCSLLLSACTVRMYHCPDILSCLYCSLVLSTCTACLFCSTSLSTRTVRMCHYSDVLLHLPPAWSVGFYCLLVLSRCIVRLYCPFVVCTDIMHCSLTVCLYCPHVPLSRCTVRLYFPQLWSNVLPTCTVRFTARLYCPNLLLSRFTVHLYLAFTVHMYSYTARLYCSLFSACTVRLYHCTDVLSACTARLFCSHVLSTWTTR